MNPLEMLVANPFAQALGWALVHFVWQGSLIALLYLVVSRFLRGSTPEVRYSVACAAMLLMLLAPVATILVRNESPNAARQGRSSEPAISATAGSSADASAVAQLFDGRESAVEPTEPKMRSIARWATIELPRFIPWLLALWLAGVLLLSLRFAGGLVRVRRLKRAETGSSLKEWENNLTQLCRSLRLSRPVRVCESALVEVPTVIGWLKPVILIPVTALTGLSADQLQAILAHELAHIRRHDYLVNLLQTAVETLLFYHPAVWWVSAQIRQEREHCCDDMAVSACGDVLMYARALTALEQARACEPQLAVAASGGSLIVRIQRLLYRRSTTHFGIEGWFASLIAVAVIATVLAATQASVISRKAHAAAIKEPVEFTLSQAAGSQANHPAKPAESTKSEVSLDARQAVEAEENSDTQTSSSEVDDQAAQQAPPESNDFAAEMAAVGLANLGIDKLIALETHGVTPAFVREMSALVSDKLTAGDVVAMKIHGVTPAFANEMKALGLRLNCEQLLAFRIHGVTSQFVNGMKSAGLGDADADALVAFRIHGVTPAFVQQMKDFGFDGLSGDDLTAFRIHGVTPEFIQTMRSYIHGKLSGDDLLGLRIHGVTPETIKELETVGFSNLSTDELTAFRIHGVTPAFIKQIHAAGYPKVTADELTTLRIFGVTPEFIQTVRSRGFTDVTLEQLVELRRLNLMPSRKTPN